MNDYKKLGNQPLQFVIAEFRFSSVLQIADYIPKLQEALRKSYPRSDKTAEQAIQVQPAGIAVSTLDDWSFMAANKKSAVDINQERLVYYTAEYPGFKGFSAACEEALDALADIVAPSLIVRVGLRYGNRVTVSDNEKLPDLVDAHLVPPSSLSRLGDSLQQRNEALMTTPTGLLAIRTLYGYHDLACLPDLQGLPIMFGKDQSPDECLLLDFDHAWQPRDDEAASFAVDDLLNKLSDLHETSRAAFWTVTTDYARDEKWG